MSQKKMKAETHGFLSDFKKFISRGNVLDMAVGVAVASAFSKVVSAFTAAFLSPLIAAVTGSVNLGDMVCVIREDRRDELGNVILPGISVPWGAFVQAILDFLIVAFVLFLLIRAFAKASEKAHTLPLFKEEQALAAQAAEEELQKREAAERLSAEALAREKETVALLREIRGELRDIRSQK